MVKLTDARLQLLLPALSAMLQRLQSGIAVDVKEELSQALKMHPNDLLSCMPELAKKHPEFAAIAAIAMEDGTLMCMPSSGCKLDLAKLYGVRNYDSAETLAARKAFFAEHSIAFDRMYSKRREAS
jgi:hypothetical protein